ncbi:MAG TPA: hypothetical protein VFE84_06960 [Patescibacteria group bacterium]|jgi:hypothetical protein|nr:hypothetical protein [Patescibacteria group bacterium]
MPVDRIIRPEAISALLREYLEGVIDGAEASLRALRLAGSTDRILSGHQTRVIVAAYWALRRLAESPPTRPTEEDLRFLLDCIEGRKRFPVAI